MFDLVEKYLGPFFMVIRWKTLFTHRPLVTATSTAQFAKKFT